MNAQIPFAALAVAGLLLVSPGGGVLAQEAPAVRYRERRPGAGSAGRQYPRAMPLKPSFWRVSPERRVTMSRYGG